MDFEEIEIPDVKIELPEIEILGIDFEFVENDIEISGSLKKEKGL